MVAGIIVTVCIILSLLSIFVCFRSYRYYQNQAVLRRHPPPDFPTLSVAYSTPSGAVATFPAAPPPNPEVLVVSSEQKITFNEPPPPYPGLTGTSATLPTYDQLPGSANSPSVSFRSTGFYRSPDPQHVLPQKH